MAARGQETVQDTQRKPADPQVERLGFRSYSTPLCEVSFALFPPNAAGAVMETTLNGSRLSTSTVTVENGLFIIFMINVLLFL